MTTDELNALKGNLIDYVNSITTRSKGPRQYVCPLCKSGTGKNKTGAFSIQPDGQRWKCFSCGAGGDIFDLCAQVENLSASDAAKRIISLYGTQAAPATPPHAAAIQAEPAEPVQSFSDEIAAYAGRLDGSDGAAYLQRRGFTAETVKRFNLGYDPIKRAVTVPYDTQDTYYGRRYIDPQKEQRYDNLKNVPVPLFNPAALYSGSDVVFVVEGPFCAISIAQAGGAAVALSGVPAGNARLLKQLKARPTPAALAICLDSDDAGRKAAQDLEAKLKEMGYYFQDCTAMMLGENGPKDPNDLLQAVGPEPFQAAIQEAVEHVRTGRKTIEQEANAERQQRTGAGMVDAFLQAIQTRKYEPVPTGIHDLDTAIGGGLIRQQLVLLGGAPGTGKTGLAQWLFEGMAQDGQPCIYLNLEMSRDQLLARSVSRIAAGNGHKITTTRVLQGYSWTDEQRAAVLEAIETYKTEIAPRMIYNPDDLSPKLGDIMRYIENEAGKAEKAGEKVPFVVLDYLQIVAGEPGVDEGETLKQAVSRLKKFAIKHNTVVFAIIAHNRESNKKGSATMESARDTSALEYSADLQLALTFTACLPRLGKDAKKPEALTDKERNQKTLCVVKGRFGGVGKEANLIFNGETMTFTQAAADFRESSLPSPFEEQVPDGVTRIDF